MSEVVYTYASEEERLRVPLTSEEETELGIKLVNDVQDANRKREDKLIEWREAREDYKAEPGPGDWPWEHASDVTVPIGPIQVDAWQARIMMSTVLSDQFVTVNARPGAPKATDTAKAIQTWLNYVHEDVMNTPDTAGEAVMESVKINVGFVKLLPEQEKTYEVSRGTDEAITEKEVQGPVRPCLYSIKAEDIILPNLAISDIQKMPWVCHRLHMNKYDFEEDTRFSDTDKTAVLAVEGGGSTASPDEQHRVEQSGQQAPTQIEDAIELYEIWKKYKSSGMKTSALCVFLVHPKTNKILMRSRHPYWHGLVPIFKLNGVKTEFDPYGDGILKRLKPCITELSDIHNTRINLAQGSMTGIAVKRGSLKGQTLNVYPACIFETEEDPKQTFLPFQLAGPSPSLDRAEITAMSIAKERGGASDPFLGVPMGSRTTATEAISTTQEGAKKFNWEITEVRRSFATLSKAVLLLYAQYGVDHDEAVAVCGEQGAALLESALQSISTIKKNYSFSVVATSASANQAMERQDVTFLVNMMSGLYKQILGSAQMLAQLNPQAGAPQLVQYLQKSITGMTKLGEQALKLFGQKDVIPFLPTLEEGGDNAGQSGSGLESNPAEGLLSVLQGMALNPSSGAGEGEQPGAGLPVGPAGQGEAL